MSQDYIEKNRGFITSSKLKEFMRCQLCYKWKYEDEIPDPTDEFDDKDYFTIGTALDDRLTYGEAKYKEKYAIVARRSKDGPEEGRIELTRATAETVEKLYQEFRQNVLFNQLPQKKILTHEFAGMTLKCELDDFDGEMRLIRDIKTCANLSTFNPEFYLVQMSFYEWLIEENEGIKCEALLQVVDKYKYFSRSRAYLYSHYTLEAHRGVIINALEELKMAKESGMYMPAKSENVLLTCPYYGRENHGRPTKPISF